MFLNTIRSPQTANIYRCLLLAYMRFHSFKSTKDMLDRNTKLIETDIIKFLAEKKASAPTIKIYLSAVRHFYSINDITLNWYKLKRYRNTEYVKRQDRAYTVEEIQKLVNTADLRQKAIVLILASTGMRIGAIPDLKIKNVLANKEFKNYQITVYPGTKDEYVTFCTPEARKAIEAYLDYRKRAGEIIGPEAPLIREQFDKNSEVQAQHPKPVTLVMLRRLLDRLLVDAGLKKVTRLLEGETSSAIRHEVAQAHGFRKWFNTVLKNTEVKALYIETFLGHKTGLDSHYFRPTEKDLAKEYAKAIDALTIDPANRLQKEIETLKTDREQFKQEVLAEAMSQIREYYRAETERYEAQKTPEQKQKEKEVGEVSERFDSMINKRRKEKK